MAKFLVAALLAGAALAVSGSSAPVSAQMYPHRSRPPAYYPGDEALQPIAPFVVHGLGVRGSSDYGAHLTDASGRALYLSTGDRRGRGAVPAQSACYGPCIKAWHPAYAAGPVFSGANVDRSQIGVVVRADGRAQVTYNGWPLYYYAGDLGAAQTQGEDVQRFDRKWYLVSPRGVPVQG